MGTLRRLATGLVAAMATLASIGEPVRAYPLVPGNRDMETWGAIDGYIYVHGNVAVIAPDGGAESWLVLTYADHERGSFYYENRAIQGPRVPGTHPFLIISRVENDWRKARFNFGGGGGRTHGLCLSKLGDVDLPPCDPGPSTHHMAPDGTVYFDPVLTQ